MKMEQTECSETSAYRIQTPGNYPEESIQHSKHGEGWKSRILLTYLRTYALIPWIRVLVEKLTGLQLVKKFPAFYGTRRFITAFTSAHQLSLS